MIRFPNERRKGGRLSSSMRRFSKVIDDLDLRDLHLQGGSIYLEWRVEQSNHIKT